MAYNPRNKLMQMQDVIDVYLEHKEFSQLFIDLKPRLQYGFRGGIYG